MLLIAARPISFPTMVEPVKEILSTPECAASCAPAPFPTPVHDVQYPVR